MTPEQFALAAEGAGFQPTGTQPGYSEWFRHPDTKTLWITRYDEGRMIVTFNITQADLIMPISLQRLTHLFKAFQL